MQAPASPHLDGLVVSQRFHRHPCGDQSFDHRGDGTGAAGVSGDGHNSWQARAVHSLPSNLTGRPVPADRRAASPMAQGLSAVGGRTPRLGTGLQAVHEVFHRVK